MERMKVSCGHCSELHDLSHMEPSYAMPDCIHGSSLKDIVASKDICAIPDAKRGFLRLLLPIPVEGEGPCNWGVWVELDSYTTFLDVVEAWNDDSLLKIKGGRQARQRSALVSQLTGSFRHRLVRERQVRGALRSAAPLGERHETLEGASLGARSTRRRHRSPQARMAAGYGSRLGLRIRQPHPVALEHPVQRAPIDA